jgi:hypothetical protein
LCFCHLLAFLPKVIKPGIAITGFGLRHKCLLTSLHFCPFASSFLFDYYFCPSIWQGW